MPPEQFIEGTVSRLPAPPPLDQTLDPLHPNPRFELRCLDCGYGAISAQVIRCPMCRGEAWDFAEWRPFSR